MDKSKPQNLQATNEGKLQQEAGGSKQGGQAPLGSERRPAAPVTRIGIGSSPNVPPAQSVAGTPSPVAGSDYGHGQVPAAPGYAPGYGAVPQQPGAPTYGYGQAPPAPGYAPGYGAVPQQPGAPAYGYGQAPPAPGYAPGYGAVPQQPGAPAYGYGQAPPAGYAPGYGAVPGQPGAPGYGYGQVPPAPGYAPGYGAAPGQPGAPAYGYGQGMTGAGITPGYGLAPGSQLMGYGQPPMPHARAVAGEGPLDLSFKQAGPKFGYDLLSNGQQSRPPMGQSASVPTGQSLGSPAYGAGQAVPGNLTGNEQVSAGRMGSPGATGGADMLAGVKPTEQARKLAQQQANSFANGTGNQKVAPPGQYPVEQPSSGSAIGGGNSGQNPPPSGNGSVGAGNGRFGEAQNVGTPPPKGTPGQAGAATVGSWRGASSLPNGLESSVRSGIAAAGAAEADNPPPAFGKEGKSRGTGAAPPSDLGDSGEWGSSVMAKYANKAPVLEAADSGGSPPPHKTSSRKKVDNSIPLVGWVLIAGVAFLAMAVFIFFYNKTAVVSENMPKEDIMPQRYQFPPDVLEEFSAKDPVTKRPVPSNSPYRLDAYGATFIFESDATRKAFVEDPFKYIKPNIKVKVNKVQKGEGDSQINIVGPDGRALIEGQPDAPKGGNAGGPPSPPPPGVDGGNPGTDDDGAFDIPLTPQDGNGAPGTGDGVSNNMPPPGADGQGNGNVPGAAAVAPENNSTAAGTPEAVPPAAAVQPGSPGAPPSSGSNAASIYGAVPPPGTSGTTPDSMKAAGTPTGGQSAGLPSGSAASAYNEVPPPAVNIPDNPPQPPTELNGPVTDEEVVPPQ